MNRVSFHPLEKVVTDAFTAMYYWSSHGTWNGGVTTYKGVAVLQNPFDMWIKQEIIHLTKPDVIIETGSACGGSAYMYTDMFPKLKVISIDHQQENKLQVSPPRVTFLKGYSTDKKIYRIVEKEVRNKRVIVILDSDHHYKNVLAEMNLYSPLVTPGCYMVVEDTCLDSEPLNHPDYVNDGPMKAVNEFFTKNNDFLIDHDREKFYMTFYPNGWLLKK